MKDPKYKIGDIVLIHKDGMVVQGIIVEGYFNSSWKYNIKIGPNISFRFEDIIIKKL